MPFATTIFLPRAHRITKSSSFKPCLSASSWIRLLSSSVQRIAIVVFRFLMLSISFFLCQLKWVRASARQAKAAGGMPAAMLANPKGLIFSSTTTFLPLPIVPVWYRHTRSTLRHNRFHRRRWDNYPISVSEAKTGVFVPQG